MFFYGNGNGRRILGNHHSWRVVTSYRLSHTVDFFCRFKGTRETAKPLPFGNEAPYTANMPVVNGIELTSSIGNETVSGASNSVLSGIGLTNAIGVEAVSGAAGITETGNALTGSIGTVTVTAEIGTQDAEVIATGNELTSALGNEVVSGKANFILSGLDLTESLGSEIVGGAGNFELTGIDLTGALGIEVISGAGNFDLTGIDLTGALGTEVISGASNRLVTGVEGAFTTGTVTVTAASVSSGRPKVISFKQWLGNLPLADSYLALPKEKKKVNAVVFVEPELFLKTATGTVMVNSQARCKVIPFKRINLEVGKAEIQIDYRNKMRKQEEEFIRFLMVA